MTPLPLPSSATASLGSEGDGVGYTLNEPVSVTIMRDLRRVGKKLATVLLPMQAEAETLRELRDWDLWGPLLLCLALSIITSWRAPAGQQSLVFASVFVLVWVGAAVVTLNGQLLGGKMCVGGRRRGGRARRGRVVGGARAPRQRALTHTHTHTHTLKPPPPPPAAPFSKASASWATACARS